MKTIITSLLSLLCSCGLAQDWTIHCAFNCNGWVNFIDSNGGGVSGTGWSLRVQYGYSFTGPFLAPDHEWGLEQYKFDFTTSTWTYNDSVSAGDTLIVSGSWIMDNPGGVFVEQMGPDFNGSGFIDGPASPCEFWIDFSPLSTPLSQVPRVSLSLPSDFGKYEWDGSINPNYVEPLTLRGKGHKKK